MAAKTLVMTREDALAQRRWFVVDAEGRALGRVATQVANLLRGKGKPTFSPHIDCGDFVVVVNASKVRLTGQQGRPTRSTTGTPSIPGGMRATAAAAACSASSRSGLVRDAVAGDAAEEPPVAPSDHQAQGLHRARSIRTARSRRSPSRPQD